MDKSKIIQIEVLSKINEEFYQLIENLRKENFEFCAYVVKKAYEQYMAEVEERLEN